MQTIVHCVILTLINSLQYLSALLLF